MKKISLFILLSLLFLPVLGAHSQIQTPCLGANAYIDQYAAVAQQMQAAQQEHASSWALDPSQMTSADFEILAEDTMIMADGLSKLNPPDELAELHAVETAFWYGAAAFFTNASLYGLDTAQSLYNDPMNSLNDLWDITLVTAMGNCPVLQGLYEGVRSQQG